MSIPLLTILAYNIFGYTNYCDHVIQMTNMDPVMMMYQDNVLIDEIVSRIVSEVSPVATVESLAGESRVWAVTEEAVSFGSGIVANKSCLFFFCGFSYM